MMAPAARPPITAPGIHQLLRRASALLGAMVATATSAAAARAVIRDMVMIGDMFMMGPHLASSDYRINVRHCGMFQAETVAERLSLHEIFVMFRRVASAYGNVLRDAAL
jgi:hypothetical protein